MVRVDGVPATCPRCGSDQLDAVGRDLDEPHLDFIECADCEQGWRLETLIQRLRKDRR